MTTWAVLGHSGPVVSPGPRLAIVGFTETEVTMHAVAFVVPFPDPWITMVAVSVCVAAVPNADDESRVHVTLTRIRSTSETMIEGSQFLTTRGVALPSRQVTLNVGTPETKI